MTLGYVRLSTQLAIGSAPPVGARFPFDLVVLCAKEYQPRSATLGVPVLHVPLDDRLEGLTAAELALADNAAHMAVDAILRGRRVLVTCSQGRNRSGWVAARTLQLLGMPMSLTIARVKRKVWEARRVEALANPGFVRQLLELA